MKNVVSAFLCRLPWRALLSDPMASLPITYALPTSAPSPVVKEEHIEYGFIGKLQGFKYDYRGDIRDRAALEANFRDKFEALNRVHLSDSEFARLLDDIATQHHLAPAALQTFVDSILQRMIFDGDALSDLMAPLDLGWRARAQAELALMKELAPLLTKRAQGREISGLSAYEQ